MTVRRGFSAACKAPPFQETFEGTLFAPGRRPAANAEIMKKNFPKPGSTARADGDDILPEYDFSGARPNKYASRHKEGASVVTLDPPLRTRHEIQTHSLQVCGRLMKNKGKLRPGASVILRKLPPNFLRGLPRSDKKAISAVVGKPVRMVECAEDGRAELKFTDKRGTIHFLHVSPSLLTVRKRSG